MGKREWYKLSYPDGSATWVEGRDEAVRIHNSDGAVYGVTIEITGPYPKVPNVLS
jgi:hypothetical protein